MLLLLRKDAATDDVDISSMSFRQKLESDLQKPLSKRLHRSGSNRPGFNVESGPEREIGDFN